jgi:hypothetical protein
MNRSVVVRWSACALFLLTFALPAGAQVAPPAGETATQFYLRYREAFAKATKIEDVLPFMSAETRAQVDKTPADERPKMFEFVKMMSEMQTGVKVVREDRTTNGATLTVEATDTDKNKVTGTITIVREGGAWKLGRESWKS